MLKKDKLYNTNITDVTYISLKRRESSGGRLTEAQLIFLQKMESLDYMTGFRSDWYPEDVKKTTIQKLKKELNEGDAKW